jgi:DNA-binding response OmpR family regulator
MNRTTVIVCDHDRNEVNRIQQRLISCAEFELVVLNDALALESTAIEKRPSIVIANPEVHAFNEYDVCKQLMKDHGIPVLLLLDRNSTHRAQIDECRADDVLTKPVELDDLISLLHKHMSVHQTHGQREER